MQFSESWLRSLCNPPLSTDALCHLLTMAGLEVEEVKPAAAGFTNVVVAQILTTEKHPDADKLKLCSVDVGQEAPLQIVCGAPNAAAGMKVPCAMVGAKLPSIEIRKAKVRGIESFGMLCSARELGLSDDSGGLLALPIEAEVGTSIRSFLDLDDNLITIKLTPNRADCLSLHGIARELSALTGAPLTLPVVAAIPASHSDTRAVVLDVPDACSRYCGRVVRNVNAGALTPEWMVRRIERSGLHSISAVVDVTNYVMLELGQPLHAFDNATLSGAIHVRYPKHGESLKLLNEQVVSPSADTALIADESCAVALAGIMGGAASSVTNSTTDLFLEGAFFSPNAIVGRARNLGFSSDAAHRFERGVDFALARTAIERATALIGEICGGEPGPVVETVVAQHLPKRQAVILRAARVAKILGVTLDVDDIEKMLTGLGLVVVRNGDRLEVTPPSFRFDVEREEDLIEEIARIYGYENIPSNPPVARVQMMPVVEDRRTSMQLRRLVAERDFHEVVNFSFVDKQWESDFAGNTNPIILANPIASQMGVMRSSLIGGLVDTLRTNRKRRVDRVRVFELGRCFIRSDCDDVVPGYDQPVRVACLAAGTAEPEQWGVASRRVDFYDLKADLEALFAPRALMFEKSSHPALHPGRTAAVFFNGKSIGVIGELHPRWVQSYELVAAPVVFEVKLAPLLDTVVPSYAEVSRFPAVTRDLALVVSREQSLGPLLAALRNVAPPLVRDLTLFDIYHGKGLNDNEKSLAFRIVMQDTLRTLEEQEVDAVIALLMDVAARDFNATLRV